MRILVVLLLLAGCAAPLGNEEVRSAVGSGPALWRASSPTATVYLFGTMHLVPGRLAWLTPTVEAAFARSDSLWVETDIDDHAALRAALGTRLIDPSYDLSSRLPATDWAMLTELSGACGFGHAPLAHFRPWAMNMLIQSCGMTPSARNPAPPEATPDVYLVSTARATGRQVHGFETWQQHIDAFAGIPEQAQLDVLRNGLDAAVAARAREQEGKRVPSPAMVHNAEMVMAWLRGDVGAEERLVLRPMRVQTPALYEALLTRRNVGFAAQIGDLLRQRGTAFVAVGAGHFLGEDGIVPRLRDAGITVARIE